MSATSAIAIWPYEGFRDAVDALNFSDYRSPEEHAKAAGQDLINSGKCLLVAAAGAVALFVPFFPVALAGGIVAGTGVTCAVTAAIAAPVELIRAGVISTGATSDKAPDTQNHRTRDDHGRSGGNGNKDGTDRTGKEPGQLPHGQWRQAR